MLDPSLSSSYQEREYRRVVISREVRILWAGGESTTLLKDVSLGGVGLIWFQAQEYDEELTVHFSTELAFVGKVRWCKALETHYEVGLQFLDLDEIAGLYFAEYLQSFNSEALPATPALSLSEDLS